MCTSEHLRTREVCANGAAPEFWGCAFAPARMSGEPPETAGESSSSAETRKHASSDTFYSVRAILRPALPLTSRSQAQPSSSMGISAAASQCVTVHGSRDQVIDQSCTSGARVLRRDSRRPMDMPRSLANRRQTTHDDRLLIARGTPEVLHHRHSHAAALSWT